MAAAVIQQPQLPATPSRAVQRVLGTVLGTVLAGARLLGPRSERELFPSTAAEALDAVRALARRARGRRCAGAWSTWRSR